MKIELRAEKSFENQRLLMNLNGAIGLVKNNQMFIKQNELGEYDIERLHIAMTLEEKTNFWDSVVSVLNNSDEVDALIIENTLYVFKKGECDLKKEEPVKEDVVEEKKTSKKGLLGLFKKDKKDADDGHEEVEQKPKKAARAKATKKSGKLSTKSE